MRRHPSITPQQSDYIRDLFRKGRTVPEVQAATNRTWTDGTLEKLRDIAGRGRP